MKTISEFLLPYFAPGPFASQLRRDAEWERKITDWKLKYGDDFLKRAAELAQTSPMSIDDAVDYLARQEFNALQK